MSGVLQPKVSATVAGIAAALWVTALTSIVLPRSEKSAAEQVRHASFHAPNGTRFAVAPFIERWRNPLILPAPTTPAPTSLPVLDHPQPVTVAMADTSIAPVVQQKARAELVRDKVAMADTNIAPMVQRKARAELVRDKVCGDKGRQWYTKANGWRYWRCIR